MSWAEVLLIIVSHCGLLGQPAHVTECRHDRIECMKKGVAAFPNGNNAVELMDACLAAPASFDNYKPKTAVSPSPAASASTSHK